VLFHERVRVLFLENEDSFTWNVLDALPCERSEVLLRPGRQGRALVDAGILEEVDAVLLGPGPTDPVRAGLVGVVRAVAAAARPMLGICLGHQALGLAFGARLVRTRPAHGKASAVRFQASRLFPGIGGELEVMRYHSLSLAEVAPPLRVVAATADGIPMAVEHESLPLAGLQFHPDSYATPAGGRMIAAFFEAIR
jgi:anthranilate synthase/aminodeoxychorismate synthase-like glutamine amidotransferase